MKESFFQSKNRKKEVCEEWASVLGFFKILNQSINPILPLIGKVCPRIVHQQLFETPLAGNVRAIDAILVQRLDDDLNVNVEHAGLEAVAVALPSMVLPDDAAAQDAPDVDRALFLDAEA